MNKAELFVSRLHPDVFVMTKQQAQDVFDAIDVSDGAVCTWTPECDDAAVRVAVYNDEKLYTVKLLCERHKQMGMW